jgi:hypothetical protein
LILALPLGGKGKRTFQCFDCDRPDPLKTGAATGSNPARGVTPGNRRPSGLTGLGDGAALHIRQRRCRFFEKAQCRLERDTPI